MASKLSEFSPTSMHVCVTELVPFSDYQTTSAGSSRDGYEAEAH